MSATPMRPGAVLLITSAAAFLSSLDLFIVNIAFPAISDAFGGARLAELSWVLNGYTVVFAAMLALAGRLADRFGHKRIFLAGLVTFTIASAACALAPSIWLLVGARGVQGIGAALIVPTSLSLLLAAWPPQRRGVAVGTWAAIGAVAAALGPPLGGFLVTLSWQWVFLVNIPVGIAALLAGTWLLRESDVERSGRPDALGAVLLIVGVGSLAFALVSASERGWSSAEVILGGVLAVSSLAVVVVRSRRHSVPALDLRVLRVPVIATSSAMMLLFSSGFAGMLIVNVLFLTETWGWSAQAAGLALAPGPTVVIVMSHVAGHLANRIPVGVLATVGALCFAAGNGWWLGSLDTTERYASGMLPGQLFTGLGVGLILPTLSSVVGSALPASQWGSGSSIINTARQIGSVLGVALVVTVLGAGTQALPADLDSVRSGWALLTAIALGAAVIGAVLTVLEHQGRHRHDISPRPR